MNLQDLKKTFKGKRNRFVAEWKELLRFPSISASPDHKEDCRKCAKWLVKHLAGIGLKSRLIETIGNPLVFAEFAGRKGGPTVLYYGHYDVQPEDPIDEWTSPPFQPTLRDGRLYARGAEDNKGQLFYVVKAVETLLTDKALECPLKIIIEGEEEYGSKGIAGFVNEHGDELKADVLMVTDVGTVSSGDPTIIMGLRGVGSMTVRLSGPLHDLHSGLHGGLAPNPAQQMARLLATLHNADGGIAVKGFCNGVALPTDKELQLAQSAPFDEAEYHRQTGVPPVGGEKQFPPVVRNSFRPTIEINGIHSGYGGPGSKTIIPAGATAKISCRFVTGQDPEASLRALEKHLRINTPTGLNLEISEAGVAGPSLRLNPDSPVIPKARDILYQVTGRQPVYLYDGASIPIVAALARASGAEPLLVGFSRTEDRTHAPNESFSLEQFEKGFLYASLLLGTK